MTFDKIFDIGIRIFYEVKILFVDLKMFGDSLGHTSCEMKRKMKVLILHTTHKTIKTF